VNREGDRSLCCADRVVNLTKTEPLNGVVELQKDRDALGFGLQAAGGTRASREALSSGRGRGRPAFQSGVRHKRGEPAGKLELELLHGEDIQVRWGMADSHPGFNGEKGEKDGELTGGSRACSERLEDVRSGRILPVSREEEEDMLVAVVGFGSIP
jgi:hypothetical protein